MTRTHLSARAAMAGLLMPAASIVSCGSTPEEPARDNPLDLQNPQTGGDPFDLRASLGASAIDLEWDGVEHAALATYRIFRRTGLSGEFAVRADVASTAWTDTTIGVGRTYCYKVAVVDETGTISDLSGQVEVVVHSLAVFSIANGAPCTSARLVDLFVNAADAESLWIWNGQAADSAGGLWRIKSAAGSLIEDWELPAGEGTKTVQAWIRYATGCGQHVSDTIEPQPIAGTLEIAGGAEYTATRTVSLTLSAPDADSMMLASTSDFAGAVWEPFAGSRSWELASGDGVKSVHLRLRSSIWFFSESADEITLDQTGPVVTAMVPTPANATTGTSSWPELSWTPASDALSGVASYRVHCDTQSLPEYLVYAGSWVACTLPMRLGSTRYTWRVVAVDGIGNESEAGPWWFETAAATTVPDCFVYVEPGLFEMGSPPGEPLRSEIETPHWVELTQGFYLSEAEVTQAEYLAMTGANPSPVDGSSRPVEGVSWFDAVDYCNLRSVAEGLTPAYTIDGTAVTWNRQANGYRLPTESEWEFACRAGTSTPFHTGNCLDADSEANYAGTAPYPGCTLGTWRGHATDVRTFPANGLGLYDMHGNVEEWCWDWYRYIYPEGTQEEPAVNPAGPTVGRLRVARGGGYFSFAQDCRCAHRRPAPPSYTYRLGFRLARSRG